MSSTQQSPLEVDDLIVLLLGAPAKAPTLRHRIEGVTRLEKLLFLLQTETPVGDLLTENPEFESHNFGPFSAKIYKAVDTLAAAGLIADSAHLSPSTEDSWESMELIGSSVSDAYATRNFELTDLGRRYYRALVRELPKPTETTIRDFKSRFGALPLRQLIRYVYSHYPEFTKKSVIREEILGK